jgi:WXG100 family type VII secretion target
VHAAQPALDAMARRCDETGSSLASGMAQLMQRIESMNGGAFAGSANTAFQGVSGELNDGLTKILNALDRLGGQISAAGAQLANQDDAAAQQIRRAGAGTGDTHIIGVLSGAA